MGNDQSSGDRKWSTVPLLLTEILCKGCSPEIIRLQQGRECVCVCVCGGGLYQISRLDLKFRVRGIKTASLFTGGCCHHGNLCVI